MFLHIIQKHRLINREQVMESKIKGNKIGKIDRFKITNEGIRQQVRSDM